jgi:ABC-type transport system involved in Fe-S cluster assembly fused permease/ATPase subunit
MSDSRRGAGSQMLREAARLVWAASDRAARRDMALVLLLVLLTSAATALAPVMLGAVVDTLGRGGNAWHIPVLVLVSLYVLLQWLTRISGQLRDLLFSRTDRRLSRAINTRALKHILALPLRFHLERKTGALTQILVNGQQGFQILLQQAAHTVIPILIEMSAVAVVLIHKRQLFFLALLFLTVAGYSVLFACGALRMASLAREASAAQGDAMASLTDGLLNYEAVKSYCSEPLVLGRFDAALGSAESQWARFFRIRAVSGFGVATCFGALFAIGCLYAAGRASAGAISAGDFVLLVSYLFQIVSPAERIGAAVQQVSQGLAFVYRLLELLSQTPEPQGGRKLRQGKGALSFEKVSLAYAPGRTVLKEVSFHVPAGGTLGIVGVSGAGKSSLVRLLLRLMEPSEGQIRLDGVATTEYRLSALRESIAVVPQDTVLFNDTIAHNIGVGRPGSTQAQIEYAARLAHLHDFIISLPEGYDTPVGERGVKLSGGERQRVAIARAALRRPPVYVFDEATSSLDSHTEATIMGNLREISRYGTTLIIAHRLSTVLDTDRIIVMDQGSVVEQGHHGELLALQGRYAALWAAQNPLRRVSG